MKEKQYENALSELKDVHTSGNVIIHVYNEL